MSSQRHQIADAPEMVTAPRPQSRRQKIARATAIVSGAALLGRGLGFLREWSIAHTIGSNGVTDAYYAASTIPDLVNYLVAGGVVGTIFIPIFAHYISDDRESDAWHVFSTVVTFLCVLLVVLIMVGEVFAPQLARMIAPGLRSGVIACCGSAD